MPNIESGFALLDVTEGRDELKRRLARGEKPRVTVEMEIDEAGKDDGTSIEFVCIVKSVEPQ